MRVLNELIELLRIEDPKNNNLMNLTSTLTYQVELIIESLEFEEARESSRPGMYMDVHYINTAIYFYDQLREIFPSQNEDSGIVFKKGYKELEEKLCSLFTESEFHIDRYVNHLLRDKVELTNEFYGDPFGKEFQNLESKYITFLASIRLSSPRREVIFEGFNVVVDPNGRISVIVDHITKGLLTLCDLAHKHFDSFEFKNEEELDTIEVITKIFLRNYPSRFSSPFLRKWGFPSIHP